MDLGISVAINRLNAYSAQLQTVNRLTNQSMGRVGRAVSGAQNHFNSLANEVPIVGRAMTALKNPIVGIAIALAGITSAGVDAVKVTRDFQKQVADTAAIAAINKTDAAYGALIEKARQLGRDTEFSATESARAMEFLARAGFSTEQAIASAEQTLSLATVGNLELAKSADIASNVLSQYGLTADNAAEQSANLGRVVDIIAKTTTSANTNVTQFADAMNYLGPTAKALGIEIEEASAAIGILGNSGLQGTLATRALGTSLVNLTKPTARAAAEIEKIGLNAFNSEGQFAGLSGLISQLETAYAGYTQEQTQASLATIFGAEAIQELNILLSAGSAEISKYTREIEAAGNQQGGFAAQVRATKLDTFDGAIRILRSSYQDLQIEIGSRVLPALTSFARMLTEGIRNITDFVRTSQAIRVIGQIMTATKAAIIPVVQAIGAVVSSVFELVSVISGELFGAASGLGSILGSIASGALSLFADALSGVAILIRGLASAITTIIGIFKEYETVTIGLAVAFGTYIVATRGLAAAQVAGRAITLAFSAAQLLLSGNITRAVAAMRLLGLSTRATSAIMGIASVTSKGLAGILTLLTGGFRKAMFAARALFAALLANPIIAIVAAIAGIVVALIKWQRETGKVGAIFSGTMAFIKTLFANFAKGFILIAAGVSEIWAGIFDLDFERVSQGVAALGRGIRLQTIDIAKGASDAFDQAYNKKIEEHAARAAQKTKESLDELGTNANESAKRAGEKLATTFADSFTNSVSQRVASGQGLLDAINAQVQVSNSALSSLQAQVESVANTVDGRRLATQIQTEIKEKLSEGLISQEQANQLAKDIEAKLKPAIDAAAKASAGSVQSLQERLRELQGQLNSLNLSDQAVARVKSQVREIEKEIADIKLRQIEVGLSAVVDTKPVDELKARVDALQEVLDMTRPGPGFDELTAKIQEARRELEEVRLFRLDTDIQSVDTLQDKLQILQNLSNSIGPRDPQFTSIVLEIERVEQEIQKLENRRILIKAGIEIDPDRIVIPSVEIPALELQADINVTSNLPTVIQPVNELTEAAEALGFSLGFVSRAFRDVNDLSAVANSQAFEFARTLGATSDQAAVFALGLENLKEQVQTALVDGVASAFQSFGQEMGKALATGQSATAAFETLFKGLLSVILAEVPKLVGTFLLQSAVGLGFPAGLPLAAAGIGLLAFSGLASGLLSNIGNSSPQIATPSARQLASDGVSQGLATQSAGLSRLNAGGDDRQTITNLTVVLDADGIANEIERRQIINNENTFGG